MFKLCLYDMKIWFDEKDNVEIITETEIEPNVGDNLDINGKTYHVCAKYPKGKLVGLRPILFSDEPDEMYDENFICPFCGNVDHDAFELDDEGTTNCGSCGSELEYSREVSIHYNVTPVRKKEPITV